MPAGPLTDNPFSVLTAVVAPAILTNASSVLCLGTANRLARVVDRTRVVTAELANFQPASAGYQFHVRQLEHLAARGHLLYRALRIMYASLGSFAAAALLSVIGSALSFFALRLAFDAAALIALLIGLYAVSALVFGCILMVRETRLAVQTITEEAEYARTQWHPPEIR
jgi:hypothetical protein